MTKKIIFALVGVVVVAVVSFFLMRFDKAKEPADEQAVQTTEENGATPEVADEEQTSPVGLANPASVNCAEKGGNLSIQKRPDGGEYGVCYFEDNRQCEEWALFRGECPVGGVKVTGYEDEAQVYCAITGGEVQGVGTEIPMCKRIDGTLCNAQANFEGACPDPHDPNPSAGNVEAP